MLVYEYVNKQNIDDCILQWEILFWSCKDIDELIKTHDNPDDVYAYIRGLIEEGKRHGQ